MEWRGYERKLPPRGVTDTARQLDHVTRAPTSGNILRSSCTAYTTRYNPHTEPPYFIGDAGHKQNDIKNMPCEHGVQTRQRQR